MKPPAALVLEKVRKTSMENRLRTGREFVEELASKGLSLVYQREIDLGRGEFALIFAYKWTDENHDLINAIYCRNEWNEPVFVRYDGGIYIDLPLPNITVEFIEERV
jgi:prophage DNA circulation protein